MRNTLEYHFNSLILNMNEKINDSNIHGLFIE